MRSLALLAVALALAACVAEPPPAGEQVTSYVAGGTYQMSYNAAINLLFVIDDSPAMAPLQGELATGYAAIVDRIEHATFDGLPDVHVGVVTADLADEGRLRRGRFLADALQFDDLRHRNYAGPLLDAFADLADVGTAGRAQTLPFEAMQRALSPYVNPGFIRDDAYLVVVFVTAGDDAGTASVDDVARLLKAAKTDPSKVVVGAATGTCDAASTSPRIDALLAQFPNRSSSTTICGGDLGESVALVGQLLKSTLEQPCFDVALANLNPAQPGLQPECSAYLLNPLTGDGRVFPVCSPDHPDRCWQLTDGGTICHGPLIEFEPRKYPYAATAHLECVAAP